MRTAARVIDGIDKGSVQNAKCDGCNKWQSILKNECKHMTFIIILFAFDGASPIDSDSCIVK